MTVFGPVSRKIFALLSCSALAGMDDASASTAALQADVRPERSAPMVNPYGRDLALTLSLQFNQRLLGELPVQLLQDDRLLIYSTGFYDLISPLLTPEAAVELQTLLGSRETFEPDGLREFGIQLEYDASQLAILVLRIDPLKRQIQRLYETGSPENPGQAPEDFSAYLNANVAISRQSVDSRILAPSFFLSGAIRHRNLVFEADVQGREGFDGSGYRVERQFARLVYDQPESYRRWFLGDLSPETRGRQGFAEIGGVGVIRQRQRFDSFRVNALSGGRQIVLQEPSTVRVLRNGVFQREFVLDPGQYDLSNLPLDVGSNDIQLEVLGQSGQVRRIEYRAYLDTIDLEPGDYEYGAYLGFLSRGTFGAPNYSDARPAFTGYWRKAFENRPALGVGLQLSEDVQNFMAQTQIILFRGARARFDASISRGDGDFGYAFTAGYDHFIDRAGKIHNWSIIVDYTSRRYTSLGGFDISNPISWSLTASYSRRFSETLTASISASHRISRSSLLRDSYNINALVNYRVSPEFTAQFGVEARRFGGVGSSNRDGYGVTFALIWQPRFNLRGEARYSSIRNNGSLRFQRLTENRAGSIGYSATALYNDGAGVLSGQADYIGNRFDASFSHTAFGRDFSRFGENQITTVRFGSSIAIAGGHVGIGRNIFDSFALVYPHASLGNRSAIVGDNLRDGAYVARSGPFGAAVANYLSPYINQNVRYDVRDLPPGYNIGTGVETVRPTYRSGYAIEVGRSDFVTALGRILGNGGRPASLLSGRVRPVEQPDAEPELFFTNSVGRFAIQNLEPGQRYRVELFSTPAVSFDFLVAEEDGALVNLGAITVPVDVPGN